MIRARVLRRTAFGVVCGIAAGCGAAHRSPAPPRVPAVVELGRWDDAFSDAGAVGVFALHRLGGDTVLVSDSARAASPYLPASTFKIPNSLLALELGIVRDAEQRFPMTWEPMSIEAWNRDHTFASALRYSVVPVYQIVARKIGTLGYEGWLERLQYGNEDPGGAIDRFWLEGDLRITALEQVEFLSRLSRSALPLSERSQRIVREMLVQEANDCYTLLGKTGLVGVAVDGEIPPDDRIGWFVGMVETDTASWTFALNLDDRTPGDAAKRTIIAADLLERAGVLPAGPCGG